MYCLSIEISLFYSYFYFFKKNQLAMKAVPYRKDFIQKLGNGQDESVVISEMKAFVDELKSTFDVLTDFYHRTGQDDEKKV